MIFGCRGTFGLWCSSMGLFKLNLRNLRDLRNDHEVYWVGYCVEVFECGMISGSLIFGALGFC